MDKDIVKAIREISAMSDSEKKKKLAEFDEPMASVVRNQPSTAFEMASFEDDEFQEAVPAAKVNSAAESKSVPAEKSEPKPVSFPKVSMPQQKISETNEVKQTSEPKPIKYRDAVAAENRDFKSSEKMVRGSSVEMSYNELDNIVKSIDGENMKKILCNIAKYDSYNFIGLISNEKFSGVVNSIKMVMRNYKEKNVMLDKADFVLCDDIIHAVIIDYYKPLIKKYGRLDLAANLNDIEQVVRFITNVLDKYYNDVVKEYNKTHDVKLNTFFARALVGRKVEKIIASNRLWYVYTVDRVHYGKPFTADKGVANYIVKSPDGCILEVLSDYLSSDSSNLPDEFNVYLNKSSKEYISLSYLIRVLYKCSRDFYADKAETSSGFYDDDNSVGYKYFISGLIGCFANPEISYSKDVSKALSDIIRRYFTDIDFDSEIQIDDIAITVINAYFESLDDDEFNAGLNDDDFMLDEIMVLISEIIKNFSILSVHNQIVECLVKQLARICADSTNVTKSVISYMLKCLPVYRNGKMQVDSSRNYVDILNSEIKNLA